MLNYWGYFPHYLGHTISFGYLIRMCVNLWCFFFLNGPENMKCSGLNLYILVMLLTVVCSQMSFGQERCHGYIGTGPNCTKGCEKGKFGADCEQNCSCSNIDLFCDIETGECLCLAGLTGENCTDECKQGFFGSNCTHRCACENNSTCNRTNGVCNCTVPGWLGATCNKECTNGTYELYCEGNCTCNENETCDHMTGNCTCNSGWKGINCSQECPFGLYGQDCNDNCTDKCTGTRYCDPVNGTCICFNRKGVNCTEECDDGFYGLRCETDCECNITGSNGSCRGDGQCNCLTGWTGRTCGQECPFGLYGQDCNDNCTDKCTGTRYCDPVNGTCICFNRKGVNCTEECDDGFYGLRCETDCECNITGSNGSCRGDGQCNCLAGWTGRTCGQGCPSGLYGQYCSGNCSEKCTGTTHCDRFNGSCFCNSGKGENCTEGYSPVMRTEATGSVLEDMWQIMVAAISALVVAIAIVMVIYRVKKRRRLKRNNRDSFQPSIEENPAYSSCSKETIPLENCNNEHEIHMYEDTVLENETSIRKTNDNGPNLNEVTEDKDYSHGIKNNTAATNVITENIDDDYSIPDKDSDMNKHTNGGEDLEEGLLASHSEELYDTTEENAFTKENDQHDYNTFRDVMKIQQEARRKESEMEEDYDTLTHTASEKKKAEDLEHYSSFEQVRKLSLQGSLDNDDDDDDMYNVLNEHNTKHRSALSNDSRYHHISIKDKTIDGESLTVVIPPVGLSTQRQLSSGQKLPKQSSLKESTVIIEEPEEPEMENNHFTSIFNKTTAKTDEMQEEDETEVIYDECDSEDDIEKSKNNINAQKIDASITERVYEDCDEHVDDLSRSSSTVVYEDVDDEEESENDRENEDDEKKQEPVEDKLRPHMKRTKERRREDYEDFAL